MTRRTRQTENVDRENTNDELSLMQNCQTNSYIVFVCKFFIYERSTMRDNIIHTHGIFIL